MTNSYKHTPITGIASAESDKWYKKHHSKQERMKAKDLIKHGKYDMADSEVVPYEEWAAPKDGKRYIRYHDGWWSCFDEWSREFKKWMRK